MLSRSTLITPRQFSRPRRQARSGQAAIWCGRAIRRRKSSTNSVCVVSTITPVLNTPRTTDSGTRAAQLLVTNLASDEPRVESLAVRVSGSSWAPGVSGGGVVDFVIAHARHPSPSPGGNIILCHPRRKMKRTHTTRLAASAASSLSGYHVPCFPLAGARHANHYDRPLDPPRRRIARRPCRRRGRPPVHQHLRPSHDLRRSGRHVQARRDEAAEGGFTCHRAFPHPRDEGRPRPPHR